MGEDVVYDGLDHVPPGRRPETLPLAGSYTLDSFSEHLDGDATLFPAPPVRDGCRAATAAGPSSRRRSTSRCVQAGRSLADVLGREPRPLNFVVSMRLGSWPPATSPRPRTACCACSSATRARA